MWIISTGTPCSPFKGFKLDKFQNFTVRTWTPDEFKASVLVCRFRQVVGLLSKFALLH